MGNKQVLLESAEILEKIANYISEIETKLSNSEAKVAELTKEANDKTKSDELAEPLKKLASSGYTKEELQELSLMSKDTLEKIAARAEAPEPMGEAFGKASSGLDPLATFLLS